MTSCSVFTWGSWPGQGNLLLGRELNIRQWENCTLYILFITIIVVIFFSLCCSVKLSLTQPTSFAFFFWFSCTYHHRGRCDREIMWFFIACWGWTRTVLFGMTPCSIQYPAWLASLGQTSWLLVKIIPIPAELRTLDYLSLLLVKVTFLHLLNWRNTTWPQRQSRDSHITLTTKNIQQILHQENLLQNTHVEWNVFEIMLFE